MGSLKSPCTTSYRSSIDTMALDCLVFEKISFLHSVDRQTNKQTDKQTDSIDALSRSRCRERRLNNCLKNFTIVAGSLPYKSRNLGIKIAHGCREIAFVRWGILIWATLYVFFLEITEPLLVCSENSMTIAASKVTKLQTILQTQASETNKYCQMSDS